MTDVRLIDANALKEWLGCDGDNKYRSMIMHEIADRIDEQPTIDAVHVVRCRECVHNEDEDACPFVRVNCRKNWLEIIKPHPDGFCHMGKKMDGGAEL